MSTSAAADKVMDPQEWIRQQRVKLEAKASAKAAERLQGEQRNRDLRAEEGRLTMAFAPIAEYISQLAELGVKVGADTPGVTARVLDKPGARDSDYPVTLKEVLFRGHADEHGTTWGFGVRAVQKEGRIVFENYDFEPATGQVVRLASVGYEEALERFLYNLSNVTVEVPEVSL
jgi:hypothetical protein